MLIEYKGIMLAPRNGYTDIMTNEPHMCPACRRMTFFFININGSTHCTACPSTHHLDSKGA